MDCFEFSRPLLPLGAPLEAARLQLGARPGTFEAEALPEPTIISSPSGSRPWADEATERCLPEAAPAVAS